MYIRICSMQRATIMPQQSKKTPEVGIVNWDQTHGNNILRVKQTQKK